MSQDFLVEVGTEELPPKALKTLMDAFASGIETGLGRARLTHDGISPFASPRRLAVFVKTLEPSQPDRETSQKGPPVSIAFDEEGNPTRAAIAFAKKCGVDVNSLEREKSETGEWLTFQHVETGLPAVDLVPGIVQAALDGLPIRRRMRWGDREKEFVRPVHWVVMLYGKDVISGSVLGIEAGRLTRGHRFHAPDPIDIQSAGEYEETLLKTGYVVADFHSRRAQIVKAVQQAAKRAGGTAVSDDALFDEVCALTEWPVPLTGAFDDDFLSLPREVIVATLTSHQRYFPIADKNGELKPAFIAIANLESREPDRVRNGNERVIHPRLADAKFFWNTDQQTPLCDRTEALKNVVYQKGLGSLHDKSMRVAQLATVMAEQIGEDKEVVVRAATLAKCDLMTGMVGEFPDLQGTMGAYYAADANEPEAVIAAIGEQYLPRFSGDQLPTSGAGRILAVADKLDTLAGAFLLGGKPGGKKDPFGLRRAALGVIRILTEGAVDVDLRECVSAAVDQQPGIDNRLRQISDELHEFITDRLRSYFIDSGEGITTDMFEAVFVRHPRSLVDFQDRLRAVTEFIGLESSISLAAANKRTANILRQVEFDDSHTLDSALLSDGAETVLYHALQAAKKEVAPLINERRYADALRRLAELREPVDNFFDDVMVMSDDEAMKRNRLALLAELRALFLGVADISRLTPAQE